MMSLAEALKENAHRWQFDTGSEGKHGGVDLVFGYRIAGKLVGISTLHLDAALGLLGDLLADSEWSKVDVALMPRSEALAELKKS